MDQQTGRANQLKNAAGVAAATKQAPTDLSFLRLGVSVNPDELNSTIGRGGIHVHPAISHKPADCPRAEQLWR
jgi:hypothetical protein